MRNEKYGGWIIDALVVPILIIVVGYIIATFFVSPKYAFLVVTYALVFALLSLYIIGTELSEGSDESIIIAAIKKTILKKSEPPKISQYIVGRKLRAP